MVLAFSFYITLLFSLDVIRELKRGDLAGDYCGAVSTYLPLILGTYSSLSSCRFMRLATIFFLLYITSVVVDGLPKWHWFLMILI